MKKLEMLIIGFVCLTVSVSAQAKKDSLWKVWSDPVAADTNRLKAIQALTWPMLNVNLDSAYLLAKMQLDFARKKNNEKWIAKALYNIGTHYYLKSDYPQSLSYYNQSLELRKKISDIKGEAAIYGNLGLIYGSQGNSLKDLEYQLKALEINERIRDTSNMTSNYSNLAGIYQTQGDSTKAMEYYGKALAMYKAQDSKGHIGLTYNNMGNMYRDYENYEKAKWYLEESLRIRTELQDILGIAINYINLGTLYIQMNDLGKAKEYTNLSIEYFRKLKDEASLANAYFNLGDIARRERKYHEAIKWCHESLEIAKATHKIAIEAANCSCLYRSYKEIGDHANALKYIEEYVVLNDSLKEDELRLEMSHLQFEKELLTDSLSREAEKNELISSHQQELNKRNRSTNVILYIGLGVVMLALVFLSRMLTFQRKSGTLIRKTQELEKQQLVNEISLLKTQVNPHFLFNSLSILSSLVRIDPDLSEQFIEQLARSYRYILEQKDHSLVTLRTELGFIESYAFLLKIRFESKFNLEVDLPEEILDRYKIAPLTLQLLVENAVKHNRMSVDEPLIVTISLEDNQMLVVKNKLQLRSTPTKSTGIGLQNIMNRYAMITDCPVWACETEEEFVVKIPLLLDTEATNI